MPLDPDAAAKQKAEFDLRASGKERRYAWDYDDTYDIFAADRDGGRCARLPPLGDLILPDRPVHAKG